MGESDWPGQGRGTGFLLKITRGGGGGFQEGEGPGGCLRRIGEFCGGEGAKYFCSGPKRPPSKQSFMHRVYRLQCSEGE